MINLKVHQLTGVLDLLWAFVLFSTWTFLCLSLHDIGCFQRRLRANKHRLNNNHLSPSKLEQPQHYFSEDNSISSSSQTNVSLNLQSLQLSQSSPEMDAKSPQCWARFCSIQGFLQFVTTSAARFCCCSRILIPRLIQVHHMCLVSSLITAVLHAVRKIMVSHNALTCAVAVQVCWIGFCISKLLHVVFLCLRAIIPYALSDSWTNKCISKKSVIRVCAGFCASFLTIAIVGVLLGYPTVNKDGSCSSLIPIEMNFAFGVADGITSLTLLTLFLLPLRGIEEHSDIAPRIVKQRSLKQTFRENFYVGGITSIFSLLCLTSAVLGGKFSDVPTRDLASLLAISSITVNCLFQLFSARRYWMMKPYWKERVQTFLEFSNEPEKMEKTALKISVTFSERLVEPIIP